MSFPELPTPNPAKLDDHFILGEIIDHLREFSDDLHESFPFIDLDALRRDLIDIRNHQVDPEKHLRNFLKVYQKTPVYQAAFQKLDATTQAQVNAFIHEEPEHAILNQVDGKSVFHLPPSPRVKHHFRDLIDHIFHHDHHHGATPNGTTAHAEDGVNGHVERPVPVTTGLPVIYEDDKKTMVMQVYGDTAFENWGQTVGNKPKYTFIPKTTLGLCNLVKYAKENKFRVRCGGYRHSWSPTFSQDNEIFISLLSLKEVTTIPDPLPIEPLDIDSTNSLKTVELVAGATTGADHAQIRVGVSVTNEQLRRWLIDHGTWALPMDVILVE